MVSLPHVLFPSYNTCCVSEWFQELNFIELSSSNKPARQVLLVSAFYGEGKRGCCALLWGSLYITLMALRPHQGLSRGQSP